MSPYPAKVTREGIVATARDLIESEGIEQLSLALLASALGIKAPSLYKYFASKTELLKAVNTLTSQALIDVLRQASVGDPQARLLEMTRAYRHFAHAYPVTYGLSFSNMIPEARADPAELAQIVLPLQQIWAEVVGQDRSLTALRGALAILHGYVTLELNQQLQRGGDLDQVFEDVIGAYINGWLCPC